MRANNPMEVYIQKMNTVSFIQAKVKASPQLDCNELLEPCIDVMLQWLDTHGGPNLDTHYSLRSRHTVHEKIPENVSKNT